MADDPELTGRVSLNVSRLVEGLRFAQAVTRRQIGNLVRDANSRLRGLDTSGLTTRLASGFRSVAGVVGQLGRLAAPFAAAGAAIGSLIPLVGGLVSLLAQIAPAAALAVSGVLAIGLASTTLKIAMSGVGAAAKAALDPSNPKAYEAALKKLSPNARSFVEELHKGQPALAAIKKSVQDKVFAGLDKELAGTSRVALPVFRRALDSTADTLNKMGRGVFAAARNLAKDGTLGTALAGATSGLAAFRRAPGQVVTALGQIGAAAGPQFARLSEAGAGALDKIAAKLDGAFKSGAMERAIDQAISLLGQLFHVLGNVGSIFSAVFGAAQSQGGGMLGVLEDITGELAKIAKSDGVQSGLKALFSVMSTIGATVAPLLGQALTAIGPVLAALGPPVETLIENLGAGLSPVIDALAPVLLSASQAVGALIVAASPLLPVVGELAASLLPALTPLLDACSTVFTALAPVVQDVAGILTDTLSPILAELPSLVGPLADILADSLVKELGYVHDLLVELAPTFADLGTQFADLLPQLLPVVASLAELGGTIFEQLSPFLPPLIALIGELAVLFTSGLAVAIRDVVLPALELLTALLNGDVHGAFVAVGHFVRGMVSDAVAVLYTLPSKAGAALRPLASSLADKARSAGSALASAISDKVNTALGYVRGLPGRAQSVLGNLGGVLADAGRSLINGFVNGIRDQIPSVQGILGGLTDMIPNWKGPKRKDAALLTPAGKSIIRGLVAGIDASTPSLRAKLNSVTNTIERAIGINSGNRKKTSGLGSLASRVGRDNAQLLRLAAQRDSIAAKLKAAQKKLADAIAERSKRATDIRDGILGSADITSGNSVVNSVAAITVGLQQAVAKAKAFGENLAKLKKAGLRSDLLGDIADAGVDGGGATAAALTKATPAELKKINDLQSQLISAATATGTSVAGALYDSGVRAAQGLVDGLKKQQGAIEAQMLKIATAMTKAIKKALKIKSPSRVFQGIGEMTGAGLQEGMLRSRRAVASASASMAASAVGAADVAGRALSRVPVPGQLTAAFAGTAGGGDTHNTFYLQGGEASPDGILRALSWRGLVGRR